MSALDYDKIERYIDKMMSAEELRAFEQEMLQNEELKKEVDLYKEISDTLKTEFYPDKAEQALKENLAQMREQYFKPAANIISIKRYRWWIASAAAVIIVILLVWSPWQTDLYKQYASIEMPAIIERGNTTDSLLQKASENFNAGKFAEANATFKIVLQLEPDNSYARYYYAISLLEASQIEASRKELSMVYNGNSLFRYDAAFYMALSYLKEKNKPDCIEWLNKIPSGTSVYDKAQALLRKLQ